MTDVEEGLNPGALVLFSGGQDSSVCLAYSLNRYPRVETVGFDYGQRHGVELEYRARVREEVALRFPAWGKRLGPDHMLDVSSFGVSSDTALARSHRRAASGPKFPLRSRRP